MNTIDYYYSTRSNFTYLGAARLNALADQYGRKIVHRPIILSLTMPPIGGMDFGERPIMLRNYAVMDALRWAEHLGVELLREPIHHMGPVELPSGIVIAAQKAVEAGAVGNVDQLSLLVLQALWRDDRDIADEGVIAELCAEAGFEDAQVLIQSAMGGAAQAELRRNCQEAIVRGVIGAPTYFVDNENFYGQDRLDLLAAKLAP